jgi:hypothetical protein
VLIAACLVVGTITVVLLSGRGVSSRIRAAAIQQEHARVLAERIAEHDARFRDYEIHWRELWSRQIEQSHQLELASVHARLIQDAAHDEALKMDAEHNPRRRTVDMAGWRLHA